MKWEKVKLGELYEVHNGLSKAGKFFGEGYPFLTFSTVFNNYFIPKQITDLVQSTEKEQESYSIRRGDVFVTRTSETSDELGMSCVALKDYPMATYNGFTKRMRPITNRVFPEYIGYYMRLPSFRGEFRAFSTMTTRASLRNEDLLGLEVELPPIEIQKQIAEILTTYDDLIENNQKQIKLLEETAQRLYKEWFVDLNFPGHENTKIVDGVPEGWSKSTVGNICKLRKVVITPDKIESNTPYIGLEHMPRNDICLSTWGKSEEINSNKFIYLKKDVLFGKIRPYFHKVGFALNDGITSTDTMVMVADQNLWGLLLVTVSSDAFVDFSYQNCKEGAKMPRADWKQMEKYAIMIADQATQKLFEQEILVITNKISALAFQCRSLREARDRMLPKLMGGEVEA